MRGDAVLTDGVPHSTLDRFDRIDLGVAWRPWRESVPRTEIGSRQGRQARQGFSAHPSPLAFLERRSLVESEHDKVPVLSEQHFTEKGVTRRRESAKGTLKNFCAFAPSRATNLGRPIQNSCFIACLRARVFSRRCVSPASPALLAEISDACESGKMDRERHPSIPLFP